MKILKSDAKSTQILVRKNVLTVKKLPYANGSILNVRALWLGKKLHFSILKKTKDSLNQAFLDTNTHKLIDKVFLSEILHSKTNLNEIQIKLLKELIKKRSDISKEELRTAIEAIKKGLNPEDFFNIFGASFKKDNNESNREKYLLFNHLKNDNVLWYYMPIDLKISDEDFLSGSLRIKKDVSIKAITNVVIEVKIDIERRVFFLINDYNKKKPKACFVYRRQY